MSLSARKPPKAMQRFRPRKLVGTFAPVHRVQRTAGIGHTQPPSASGAAWKASQKSAAAATVFDPARATVRA